MRDDRTPSMMVALVTLLIVSLLPQVSAEEWQLRALYNSKVNLTCADRTFHPENYSEIRYQWIFPDGTIVDPISLPNPNHHEYAFLENGTTLVILDVERHHFGVYTCLAMLPPYSNVYAAVRKGLNVDGPYFGDLIEKYMPQVKVGLFAGFFVFVVMGMLCYNYDQFQERHDIPEEDSSVMRSSQHGVALRTYANTPMTSKTEMRDSSVLEDSDYREYHLGFSGKENPAFVGDDILKESTDGHESKTQF